MYVDEVRLEKLADSGCAFPDRGWICCLSLRTTLRHASYLIHRSSHTHMSFNSQLCIVLCLALFHCAAHSCGSIKSLNAFEIDHIA